MPPVVYGRPRDPIDTPTAGHDETSTESSSPSFQLVSPPMLAQGKLANSTTDDTSYDTSVASVPPMPKTHSLETDVESESDTEAPATTTLAARMQKSSAPRATPLFFFSDDDEPAAPTSPPKDARQARMARLRELAQQRATSSSSDDEPAPEPRTSPKSQPAPEPAAPVPDDVDSDVSDDLAAPPQPGPRSRGLSKKEEREMHSMTARLRRENRTSLPAVEPKRYQLSELLSTIQHAASSPANAMHSSDPVEVSSTPDAKPAAAPLPLRSPPKDAHTRTKWAWIEQQRSAHNHENDSASDDDLEVVTLGPSRSPRVRFRSSPPPDTSRAAADAAMAHLAVHPRTPRRQRISTNEYRSPHAQAPPMPPVSDEQMSAAGHAFALAAHKSAGTLPPTSPARVDPTSPPRRAPAPPVLGLDSLNATLLQKVHAQNAQLHAKKNHHTPAPAPEPRAPSPDPAALPARAPTPSPASSAASSPQSAHSSEKENVPPPRTVSPAAPRLSHASTPSFSGSLHAPLAELPAPDLGAFFAPTPAVDAGADPMPTPGSPLARTQSNHSVLAQFFEAGTQEPVRSGSLDIFANERRSGPVGGMTQFFDATPVGGATRSQEAMPPPTRAPSGDAFAALRRAEQSDAQAPPSPDVLPSLRPSMIDSVEESSREARATDGMVYLNEDGFFTQTKPAEQASAPSSDSESDAEPPAVEKEHGRPRRPPTSAFVFGEADESDEEAQDGGHGGLAGVFSDKGSDSDDDGDQDSDADGDLSSLLDDESDEDADAKDEAARQRYMQDRDEDDAAMQALHERATKGLLRHRRRGKDDLLADLLDEDADEDELRRRLQAPQFRKSQRRQVDGDGLDALAARDDAQAFVRMYSETHDATDDHAKYDFLDAGDESSGDERVSAHTVRAEILRRQRERALSPAAPEPSLHDDVAGHVKLRPRRPSMPPKRAAQNSDDETSHYSRVLFQSGKVDVSQLPRDVQEKRARLLDEYSHEPTWQQGRGGRSGIDRRRSGPSKRSTSAPTPRVLEPATSAPSVLVPHVLRREAHFP
ncbi:hypothetical protein MCAP1_000802 [Malassezia caprae]|uniref:DNA replication checkpoint mediator MRC1 domain-containing protein n=1 Tax=Malassezia caprae TaxID=1381934 RepID=A0AAF0E343_9BASI|nr:hypothetical protein MCAP1_000802 [Malassezia caprae]